MPGRIRLTTRRKYGNTPTTVGGVRFASKREAARYGELVLMQKAGAIRGLELQVPFDLRVNGVLVCRYKCDFRYVDAATGETVVEDCKGHRTPVFKLKKKLAKACLGIEIRET